MASDSPRVSQVVPLVVGLVVGVLVGVVFKPPPKDGGTHEITCSDPGDHIVTVFPGRLSCESATVKTSAANNSVSWQASDRGLELKIEFTNQAPFPVTCSGPFCSAGPFDPNLPSGTTEYPYRASGKLSTTPPPDPRTPTPTPGVINGRIIIIKP